jgi:NAD(P)-dependent dehydrogenase (short-subunit alcohol dehydrogenase family)
MESKRVAVVTGGNRGIGLGVCRELAKLPNYVTILTSRDEAAGRAAVASLRMSSAFRFNLCVYVASHLLLCAEGESGVGELVFHQLDVASDESVETFKTVVLDKYGRVDVLVNNAGEAPCLPSVERQVPDTLTATAHHHQGNLHKGSTLGVAIKDFQSMLEVHVTGALRMTQARSSPLANVPLLRLSPTHVMHWQRPGLLATHEEAWLWSHHQPDVWRWPARRTPLLPPSSVLYVHTCVLSAER